MIGERIGPPAPTGPAPADARAHARWPLAKQILAYFVLAALALLCIWLIDRQASPAFPEPTQVNPAR